MSADRRTRRPARTIGTLLTAVALLAVSGCQPSEPPTTTLFSWQTKAPAPLQRFEAQGVAVDGKLYVFGGFTSNFLTATTRSDVYDPATNSWTRIADLPDQITHAHAVADGNSIWLMGGLIGG